MTCSLKFLQLNRQLERKIIFFSSGCSKSRHYCPAYSEVIEAANFQDSVKLVNLNFSK